jgi:transposase-like protein
VLPLENKRATMLNTKGMRFPVDVILVCIRWYAAYGFNGMDASFLKRH